MIKHGSLQKYGKALIFACLTPMIIMVTVGLTSSFVSEYHCQVYISGSDEQQKQVLMDELAYAKFSSFVLVVLGALVSFMMLLRNSKELKHLRLLKNEQVWCWYLRIRQIF